MFDCSLATTMGYTAAVLTEHKLTGLCVAVNNVTQPVENWRCGGVPILSMLDAIPTEGFKSTDLVVKSDNVDINGKAF